MLKRKHSHVAVVPEESSLMPSEGHTVRVLPQPLLMSKKED